MSTSSREQLLHFVSNNHLKKEDGLICFNARVCFHKPVSVETVSEIQIISLPNEHALYIINCAVTVPPGEDVYSSAKYIFSHTENDQLEIRNTDGNKIATISLLSL